MEVATQCVNCKEEVYGDFCHHCGQKLQVNKLTWRSLFYDLQQRVLGFDGRFLRTVRDMTIRPEKVINDFKKGVRVVYIGPVGYYFLLLTLFVLSLSILDIDMAEYSASAQSIFGMDASQQTAEEQAAQESFQKMAFGNMRLMSFIMMPWYILAIYIFFYKSKLNLLESSIFTFYTQGQPMILSVLGLYLYKYFDIAAMNFYVLPISFLYYGYVSVRFFKHNHPVWAFIKGMISWILGIIFFAIFMLVVLFAVILINPEFAKEILNIPQ